MLEAAAEVRSGRARLVQAARALSREEAAPARAALGFARTDLARAGRILRSPLLGPAAALPVVSAHVRTARALADAGMDLTFAASSAADAVESRPPGGWRLRRGALDIASIGRAREPLRSAVKHVSRARARLAPAPWVVSPLAGARERARKEIAALERRLSLASAAASVVGPMLGEGGSRRYMLAIGNLAELRGTGGFLGGYFGVVDAQGGRISLRELGRPTELLPPPGSARLRTPEWFGAAYGRHGSTAIWQNVNVTTDFPTVGAVIAQTLDQPGSVGRVDGVVQVDAVGLAPLLDVTGPLTIPGWEGEINAGNLSEVVHHRVYLVFGGSPRRFAFLGDLTRTIAQRFLDTDRNVEGATLSRLGRAVSGGHIQMYSVHPREQEMLERLGVTRGVARASGATDVLGVVSENWSPSKIDWFLHRDVAYEVSIDPRTARVRGALRVELRNAAPPEGLPRQVIGTNTDEVPWAHNRQLVLLLRPGRDRLGSLAAGAGEPRVSRDNEEALRSYSTFVTIPPQGASHVSGAFVVPAGLRGSGRHRVYRLHVLRQPVVNLDSYRIRIAAPRGWKATGKSSFSGNLHSDLVLEVRLTQSVRAWLLESLVLGPLRAARSLIFRV